MNKDGGGQDQFDFMLVTVCHRNVEGPTCWSVEKAHLAGLNFLWIPSPGDALVGRARSMHATHFLETRKAPHLIFLDSDIVFEPEDLKKLNQRQKEGYDLIGGAYTVKTAAQLAHYGPVLFDGTVQEVRFLSTGFTGISRRLLELMVKKLRLPRLNSKDWTANYPFFESGARTGLKDMSSPDIYISEDWDFGMKARRVGVRAYLDTSIKVGHLGQKIWTVQDLFEHEAQEQEKKAIALAK